MADSTRALRNALIRAGFDVRTRPTPRGDPRGDQLWSIHGNKIAKNNLTYAQAQEFLAEWRKKNK